MLAGLILAGGQSQRMGTDKSYLRLPTSNLSMLENSHKLINDICDLILVSGAQHNNGIADIHPNCGPLGGIHAGVSHIGAHYPKVTELIVIPVDMPSLTILELNQLLQEGKDNRAAVYFEHFNFPLYLPFNRQLIACLENCFDVTKNENMTIFKNKQYSIKNLITSVKAQPIKPLKAKAFNNINDPRQWQQHCEAASEKQNYEN